MHSERRRAGDVRGERVADEERPLRCRPQALERPLEDQRVGLAPPDLGGEQGHVEPLGDAHLREVAMQQIRRVEGVRHEPELQTSFSEGFEERVGGRRQPARRAPSGVLGLEETAELVVVDLDVELAEQPADLGWILDFLDEARLEEAGDIDVAEPVRDAGDRLAAERSEAGEVPGFEEVRFRRPLHERVAPVEEDRLEHRGYATRALTRRILWALLALAPVTIAVNYLLHAGETLMFVLACAALIPLAWLIGEATEHAAEHTGPGIGGFLNASFGNAPELIIALLAVSSGLPQVVKGSLAGSVISNLLLVFGVAQVVGPNGARIDRRSLLTQLGLCAVAIMLVLPVIVLGYTGNPERHLAVVVSIPIAVLLLGLYLDRHVPQSPPTPRRRARGRCRGRMVAQALPCRARGCDGLDGDRERDPRSLARRVAHAVGASEFFIAAVIVAIVGNAAEHGGAIVIAHAGR